MIGPTGSRPRLGLALLLAALLGFAVSALEPEELRIGMAELDAVAVYTRYRSCENAVLEEGPGRLAWRGGLHDREARVELEVAAGLVASILYRYPLGASEDAAALFEVLVGEEAEFRGPPAWRDSESARWQGAEDSVVLELVETEGGRELRLSIAARR